MLMELWDVSAYLTFLKALVHTHPRGGISDYAQLSGGELTMATFRPNWFLISPSL